jgi:voltage-gated potassium channel Kch
MNKISEHNTQDKRSCRALNNAARFLKENELYLLLFAALAAIVLGWIGLWQYFDDNKHYNKKVFWETLYYLMQLFSLEAGIDTISKRVPPALQIARILAPTVLAFAAIKAFAVLFRDQIRMAMLSFKRNHVIICGLGAKGWQLVKENRDRKKRVVVIEADSENKQIPTCRELGVPVIIGNASDAAELSKAVIKRCQSIFAVSGDEGANVEIAVRVYELLQKTPRARHKPVKCFVAVDDIKLAELLKTHPFFSSPHDFLKVQLLRVNDISARMLFNDHPLDYKLIPKDSPLSVHLIVAGFGHMGESVALQAARIGHFANLKKINITIIDREATRKEPLFLRVYPEFRRAANLTFVNADLESKHFIDIVQEIISSPDTLASIAICINDNTKALSCGLAIHEHVKESGVPVYVRLDTNTGLAALLGDSVSETQPRHNLHAFGMLSEICKPEIIEQEKLDKLAEKVHEDYREKYPSTCKDPSCFPWASLDISYRDSNRQQADHLYVKLRAINCLTAPKDEKLNHQSFVEFTQEELDILAPVEHARWCAERYIDGWKYAPGEKDLVKKTNRCLVDWSDRELKMKDRDKDYDAVKNIPNLLKQIDECIWRRDPAAIETLIQ